MSPAARIPSGAAGAPLGETHRSLALDVILGSLEKRVKPQVLELGPPLGANIDFLGHLGCKLYVRDLAAEVCQPLQGEPSGRSTLRPGLSGLISADVRLDLILAWDLLDYLRSSDVENLVLGLTPYMTRHTLLYALISTQAQIPEQPQRYRILGNKLISYQRDSAAVRDGPRLSQVQLLRRLAGFKVRRSFLLQNRVQEYIFEYGGAGK